MLTLVNLCQRERTLKTAISTLLAILKAHFTTLLIKWMSLFPAISLVGGLRYVKSVLGRVCNMHSSIADILGLLINLITTHCSLFYMYFVALQD